MMRRDLMRIMLQSILCIGLGFSSGCATKASLQPRSEIIDQAESKGLPVRSIDEERERFVEYEKRQQEKVLGLIRQRAEPGTRDPSYRVGPGDEIEINVFDVPELNLTAPVRQSGFVQLPLVGALQAVGRTEVELTNELTKRLSAFVRSPQVSLFIANYGSQKVAVVGAVSKPGSYALKKNSNSILELLAEAGGVTDRAGGQMIIVPGELSGLRDANDAEARARYALSGDSQSLTGGTSGVEVALDKVLGTGGGIPVEIPVRGGDMIVIPEAGKVMIEGEVEKPGQVESTRQLTLIGALAGAGGITYSANVNEVELIRDIGESEPLRLILDLEKVASGEESDVRLRSGDVIRVPTHSGRRLGEDTYKTITGILNFGVGGTVNLMP